MITKTVYKIYDDNRELFRVVKTKWERDMLVNTYKGFTSVAEKQHKSKSILELVGECLF